MRFSGFLFDLDGVLADTAPLHRAAWQALGDQLGLVLSDEQAERMKGVDRMASLAILLEKAPKSYDQAARAELAAYKNTLYQAMLEKVGPDDILPGALAALEAVKGAGFKMALASASKNGPLLVERLGLLPFFDYIADPAQARSKPAPDIFEMAASGLGLGPAACIGVEDAGAGVQAIKAAGSRAVGVGSANILKGADFIIPLMTDFYLQDYIG